MTTCSAAYNNVHQNPKQRSHRMINLHLATTHTSSLFPQLTQNLKRQHPHVKNKINQKEEKIKSFFFFFFSFGGGGSLAGANYKRKTRKRRRRELLTDGKEWTVRTSGSRTFRRM